MATLVERLELLITSSAAGAVAGLKETEAASTSLDGKAKGLTGTLQRMGISGATSGGIMAAGIAGGATIAGAAIAKFALDGVSKFADLTAEVRSLQRVMGGSAEDASRLAAAARITGVDVDTLGKGFFQLGRRIADGKDTLESFGVSVAKNHDGTIDLSSTLINAAEGYQAIGDGAHRSQFLMENFGRAGASLGPILSKSRTELEAMFAEADKNHEIFSQDQLDKGREYQESMRELHSTVTGLQIALAEGLVPTLTVLARALTASVQFMNNFTVSVDHLQSKLDPTGGAFGKWSSELGDLTGPIAATTRFMGLFGGSTDRAKEAQDRLTEAEKKLQEVVTSGNASQKELAAAQKEYAAASAAVAHQQDAVANAVANATGVVAQGTTAAKAAADAQKAESDASKAAADSAMSFYDATLALSNAQLGMEGATLNVEAAIKSYNVALFENGEGSIEARQAHVNLEQAINAVATQALEGYQAQITLAGGTETAYGKAQAQIGALQELDRQFPELHDSIQGHIDVLERIPPTATTNITLNGIDYYSARAADYANQLNALDGREIRTSIFSTLYSTVPSGFQHGGYIPGGEYQAVPIIAHGGEYVLSADVVNRIKTSRPSRGANVEGGSPWDGGGGGGAGSAGPQVIQLVVSGRVLAEVTAAELSRAGGPQIAGRAIA